MKLSRESHYAMKAMGHLARQPAGVVLEAREVADATGITRPFAAKILLQLRSAELVRSHRGRQRGYELARPAAEISARQVLEAIEGEGVFERCVFWSHTCSEANPCMLHPIWKSVRPQMADLMERVSIADLAHSDVDAVMEGFEVAGAKAR